MMDTTDIQKDGLEMVETSSKDVIHVELFAEELENRYNAQSIIYMFPIGAIILGTAILMAIWYVLH